MNIMRKHTGDWKMTLSDLIAIIKFHEKFNLVISKEVQYQLYSDFIMESEVTLDNLRELRAVCEEAGWNGKYIIERLTLRG